MRRQRWDAIEAAARELGGGGRGPGGVNGRYRLCPSQQGFSGVCPVPPTGWQAETAGATALGALFQGVSSVESVRKVLQLCHSNSSNPPP